MTVPAALVANVPSTDRVDVQAWWACLDRRSQRLLRAMVDARAEDVSLVFVDDESWRELPIELHGRLADPADAADAELAVRELTEYIQADPNIVFHLEEREFHICRAHARARRVIREGRIAAGFTCPGGNTDCPHQTSVAIAGGSLRWFIRVRVPRQRDLAAPRSVFLRRGLPR